jgi:hypothetical protein
MPPKHKQVRCRVNAYVDKGIKELVETLNEFDMLSTFSSCQGEDDYSAHIYLEFDNVSQSYDSKYLKEMVEYVDKLVILFSKYAEQEIDSAGYNTNIAIQWWGDKNHPFISIEFPAKYIKEVTNIFACVRKQFRYDNENK